MTTIKQLEIQVEYLNIIMNRPATPWTRENGRNKANIGNFHLSGAYGGYCIHEMANEGGGVRSTFGCGHVPKKELMQRLTSFIAGIEAGKSQPTKA